MFASRGLPNFGYLNLKLNIILSFDQDTELIKDVPAILMPND